jgi:hypothetical protein
MRFRHRGAGRGARAGGGSGSSQIEADVVRAYQELQENPRRVDSLRSFEASLRFHAAYLTSTNLDATVRKAIGRQIKTRGRAEWIDDLVADQHHGHRRSAELRKRHPGLKLDSRHGEVRPFGREDLDRELARFERIGIAPYLQATADHIQRVREGVGDQAAVRRVAAQCGWSFCEQLAVVVAALEFMLGFVCSLAYLAPALAAECVVIGIELATAQFIRWAFCGTW